MRLWRRTKAAVAVVAAMALMYGVAGAANLCTLTGNLTLVDGQAGANAQVFFQTISTQSFGGTVIPPSSFSVFTDSLGNLPAGVTVPQGAIVQVTVGSSQPVQIQIPLAASADLATLILANNDPPSVVSALAIGAGGDYGLSVTNPGTGAIGTAVLQPGKVSAIQGFGFSPVAPADAQVPIFSSGASQWQPKSITGDATLADDGTLVVNEIAAGGNITGKSTGGPFAISDYNVNNEFNPMQYGAKLDAREITDLSVVNGSTAVSSFSASFTAADVGKLIAVWTAASGGGSVRTFTGTITAVAAPNAVLSAPYGGASQSNAAAFIGTDDGAAINTALNAVPLNGTGVIKVPGLPIMTSQTLAINGRSLEFAGQGLGPGGPGTNGTVIIWAGGNAPVIQIADSIGVRVHDFAIMGSDQASSQPTACINVLQNSAPVAHHPSSWNRVYNIYCGSLAPISLPGGGNGNPVVGVGIEEDPFGSQNDRSIIENVRTIQAIYGFQLNQRQAIEWSFRDVTCDRDAVCFDTHLGPSTSIDNVENLNCSLGFWLGQASVVSVHNYNEESDVPPIIATPWAANTPYPRDFVIKDTNGNLEEMRFLSDGETSGATQPVWATQSTRFGVVTAARVGNVVTVTTASPHDFAPGQTVAITEATDNSFNGAFTVTGATSTTITYSQTAPDGSTTGGTAWHATTDNGVTWVNRGTSGTTLLALYSGSGGTGGGQLNIEDSIFAGSAFLPTNGDFIAGNDDEFIFFGLEFRLLPSAAHPPVGPPVVNLSAAGGGSRTFECYGCRGITKQNFNTTVTNGQKDQITLINVQRLPGGNGGGIGTAGTGEYFINALINGDPAGVDNFRTDFPGKIREFGGPLTVQQLSNPSVPPIAPSCSDGGSPANNTYFYKYTAVSGSGETIATSDSVAVSCAGQVGVSGVSISGALRAIFGADSYNIYRTASGGAPGTEKFALNLPANSVAVGNLGVNSFLDSTPDGSLGGPPPSANTTGNEIVAGVLAAGAGAATGSAAGDISAARSAGSGVLWLGSNGSQTLDFGISNPSAFTLLGGSLFSPGMSIIGSGKMAMGSTNVASLGACNASDRFSWLVVTDNNAACAYGATPTAGGAIVCPVFCDGSAWKSH
jgi:hypothetical protein